MGDNSSWVGGEMRQINDRVISVQLLVTMFISINFLLIITFFKNRSFYTIARYILFAVTLQSDSLILLISNTLYLLAYFNFTIQVWICIIISTVLILYSMVTPVTLTAMTLERYVAICMPLRHAELCSQRIHVHCILIIHGLSSLPCIVVFSSFFASASLSLYKQDMICSLQIYILHRWQGHIRSTVQQIYFLIMVIIIAFCYFKIMKVAKTASGDNKKSTRKGLRTVILHGFQLLLCLIQLWTPFIENYVYEINLHLFINVRFFNYVMFYLTPKCLSPLIYGLRDDHFFHALKKYTFFDLYKTNIFQGRLIVFNRKNVQCT
ncbi:odorant receptor 131-2-like [Acanthopagrus latus]|uniref:odorant receptor 131-2-like n=1 Tax=Acanthopagrus latus TaxID=8177 RepID=UPI00187C7E78|nr:odorant receptor 131-2-like [Acanthopagrus latus]